MNTENWAIYNLNTIFNIEYGSKLDIIKMEENPYSDIAFVTRTATNNGITMFVNEYTDKKPYSAGIMTIALGGSIGKTFIQPFRFYTCQNVAVLLPKFELSIYHKIFLKTIIEKECETKFVAFGRELNSHIRNDFFLKLPTANGQPDWQWMEEYVKNVLLPKLPENARQVWEKRYNNKPLSSQKLELKVEGWMWFTVMYIFGKPISTKGTTTIEMNEGNDILYIAAKKNDNGVEGRFSRIGNEDYISDGNCIVFINIGAGSAGYTTYQPYPFIGMQGKTSCGYSEHLNPYVGMFLMTILDKERYRYSFGRSWTGDRLLGTKIKLPAVKTANGEYEPDWQWMEDYIKGLPYSGAI